MPKIPLQWKFRKGSESDGNNVLSCGCKVSVYSKEIIRIGDGCTAHKPCDKMRINKKGEWVKIIKRGRRNDQC